MNPLSELKNFITDLMPKLAFPADSQSTFLSALDKISADKTATVWFLSLLAQHDKSETCDYLQMLDHIKAMSEVVGVHEYTLSTLLFLCLAKKLRERYGEKEISEEIFIASLKDLTYKLHECRKVYKLDGTYVAWWYPGFFRLTRFALGRLQFEIVPLQKDYKIGETLLPKDSKAINMHIPRSGKLNHDEVLEAYKLAAEFFKDEFQNEPVVFTCNSWLLYPFNFTFLPKESNLGLFYGDFNIVEVSEYEASSGTIRNIFGLEDVTDPSELPRDTTLRRAYAERIEKGEPVGAGRGIFIYEDGKIIKE